MSVTAPASGARAGAPPDPFGRPRPAPPPPRPQLLPHAGRWGRARRWLPASARRVLDVGCAFGYGAAAVLAKSPPEREVVGIERDPEHLARGHREYPWITILEGDVAALPAPDGCADAVLLLDVVEHVADPQAAIAEAHRVLRPAGTLIVSVPHRGPLRRLDALNVYSALRRRRPSWPPLEPATGSASGTHRHFALAELEEILGERFAIDRVARTGLGLEELVYLAALLARVPSGRERVGERALLAHLLVYVLGDLVPCGPLGYTLTIRATRKDRG